MNKQCKHALSLLLVCLLLLSLCLPTLATNHNCHHDSCAICHALEISMRLLFVLLVTIVCLPYCHAAARAFLRMRAEGRLFYPPVVLKVKLSD